MWERLIYLDISNSLGRSDHLAIIMEKSRCSIPDNTTSWASGHRWQIFQDLTKSHIWAPRSLFRAKKKFHSYAHPFDDSHASGHRWPIFPYLTKLQIWGSRGYFKTKKFLPQYYANQRLPASGCNGTIFYTFTKSLIWPWKAYSC